VKPQIHLATSKHSTESGVVVESIGKSSHPRSCRTWIFSVTTRSSRVKLRPQLLDTAALILVKKCSQSNGTVSSTQKKHKESRRVISDEESSEEDKDEDEDEDPDGEAANAQKRRHKPQNE
jgi:hypothetical protein